MVVQKLKLHEWFQIYQLDHIKKIANHLPASLQLDVSGYVADYRQQGIKIPATALLLKIIGQWAAAHPEVNTMLFRTFAGLRFLKGDEVRINFPLAIKWKGQDAITAIIIRNPHLKTVAQLQEEIKHAKAKPLSAYPITHWVYSNKNNFLNRFLLRSLHTVINRFPNVYWKKGGGCISLSSLSNLSMTGRPFSVFSFGSTAFTIFFKDLVEDGNKTYLNLSVAVDHNCYTGMGLLDLLNKLVMFPQIKSEERLKSLTQDVHI